MNPTIPIPFQYDEEPKRIGFCSNSVSRLEICGRFIFDDDIEMVELERIGKRRIFVCGPCVEKLLTVKPITREPEKNTHKPGPKRGGTHWKSQGPHLPQGEDL